MYNEKLRQLQIKQTSPKEQLDTRLKRAKKKPLSIKRHEKSQRGTVQRAAQTRY